MTIGYFLFERKPDGKHRYSSMEEADLPTSSKVSELATSVNEAVALDLEFHDRPGDARYSVYLLEKSINFTTLTTQKILNNFTENVQDYLAQHAIRLKSDTSLSRADSDGEMINLVVLFYPSLVSERHPYSLSERGDGHVFDRQKVIRACRSRKPPSTGAKDSTLVTTQDPLKPDAIFNGRPPNLESAPIQIFHPVFADFLRELRRPLREFEISGQELSDVRDFVAASKQFYGNEDKRSATLQSHLPKLIHERICAERVLYRDKEKGHKFIPDGVVLTTGDKAILALLEIKNSIGAGSCDPMRQAEADYACSLGMSETAAVRSASACPAFLIAICGAHIAIAGAVFTDRIICQDLTDYVSLTHGHNSHTRLLRLAQLFRTLRSCIARLEAYYSEIITTVTAPPSTLSVRSTSSTNSRSTSRSQKPTPPFAQRRSCHPCFDSFITEGGKVTLSYTSQFEPGTATKATYKASARYPDAPADRDVVVKFALSYNVEVHNCLAQARLAPEVLYYRKLLDAEDELHVVVMDFIPGRTAYDLMREGAPFPASAIDPLRKAIHCMNTQSYVFGDLRAPNVMVDHESGAVKIIDFDWCGPENEVCYPADINMSEDIQWHPQVEANGLILKDHDLHMFKVLTGQDWS